MKHVVRTEARLSPEAADRRRKALAGLRDIAIRLKLTLTRDEIRSRIDEGRR